MSYVSTSVMCDDGDKFLNAWALRSRTRAGIIPRLNSIYQPRCFAPHVDLTRARLAYGKLALPMLIRELSSGEDRYTRRQTVASIVDVLVNPEEISGAIELGIAERLAELLLSEDPFIREKVAIVYGTMCTRDAGREAILRNLKILNNLSTGIVDPLPVVRAKMAQVLEVLARHPPAAEKLCSLGFMEVIFDRIVNEQESAVLVVHLESLESLMLLNEKVKMRALEINGMENLLALLRYNDEEKVVAGALSCTAILCEPIFGKEKSRELDILPILVTLLDDQRCAVATKAANVIVFMTTTSPGKSRAFALNVTEKLIKFAVNCTRDRELQLASIKALTNIAEYPKGRSMLLSNYCMLIEDLDTGGHPTVEDHKRILLEVIRWRP